MTAPYEPGDRAAWIQLYEGGEMDVESIVTVTSVTKKPDGYWELDTDKGITRVKANGYGSHVIPLDDDLQSIIDRGGLPFSTREGLGDGLEQDLIEPDLTQGLDGDGRDSR